MMIKKKLCFLFILSFFFSLSYAGDLLMTQGGFAEVKVGMSYQELVSKFGEPYAIHDKGEKEQEVEYVERLEMNGQLAYFNHYYFTLKEGKVTNKRIETENRPAYDLMYEEDPNYPTYP